MNAPTNAVSESPFSADAIAQPATRVTRPFYWSIRRELWENRSIYIAPLAAAGLAILATLLGLIPGSGVWVSRDGGPRQHIPVPQQLSMIGLLIMGVTFVVAIFYCLDAFYGERRDRSILFWKSLPVSDTAATLAKASIPLVVLPLVTFAVAAVTQWIVLAIDAASIASHGGSLGHIPILQMQAGLLYHLIAVHALWYAPIFGWLLFVSSWAPRAPILWAFLPPLFVEIIEKIAFGTSHFGNFIARRISGGSMAGTTVTIPTNNGAVMIHPIAGANLGQFLANPGLWGGLLLTAIFLAAAVQLRRYRAPS